LKVGDDEVDAIRITTDLGIQRTRPDLGVRRKLIRDAPNVEEQRLQILKLGSSDSKKTSRPRRHKEIVEISCLLSSELDSAERTDRALHQ
jgi:hypothetical protein